MKSGLIGAFSFHHPQLGIIKVSLRKQSTLSARWRNGIVMVNAPCSLSTEQIQQAVESMATRLLKHRPEMAFYKIGQRIEVDGLTVEIRQQSYRPQSLLATARLPVSYIEVGISLNYESQEIVKAISKMLMSIAYRVAPQILFPRAQDIARNLGLKPKEWRISRGRTVLGSCRSRDVISLSATCVYLPMPLRDYIVCHELAHMDDMSHSARFHKRCNDYCLAIIGRAEREMESVLRGYHWPIIN